MTMICKMLMTLCLLGLLKFTEQCDVIFREAGGHAALIGEFYDSRTSSFVGASVFSTKYPGINPEALPNPNNFAVQWKDTASADIKIYHSDNIVDFFDQLGLSISFKLDLLSGRFTLSGNANYVKHDTKDIDGRASYVEYNIVTKKQNINWHDPTLKNFYSRDPSAVENNTFATHVVAGILWGSNTYIKCSVATNGTLDKEWFDGQLRLKIKDMGIIKFNTSGSVNVSYAKGFNTTFSNLNVKVFGDVLPISGSVPITFEKALEMLEEIPEMIARVNSGWGVPLLYELHPIESLPEDLHQSTEKDLVRSLDDSASKEMMELFADFSETQSKVSEFYRRISDDKQYVRREDRLMVSDLMDNITVAQVKARSNITMMMTQIIVGELNSSQVFSLVDNLTESNYSLKNVDEWLSDRARILYKIDLAHELVGNGSTYLGYGMSYNEAIVTVPKSYVLLFKEELMKANESRWGGNKILFLEELELDKGTDSGTEFYAVDCDLQDCGELNTTYLQIYRADKLIVMDVLDGVKADGCGVNISHVDEWIRAEKLLLELQRYYAVNQTTTIGYKKGTHYYASG